MSKRRQLEGNNGKRESCGMNGNNNGKTECCGMNGNNNGKRECCGMNGNWPNSRRYTPCSNCWRLQIKALACRIQNCVINRNYAPKTHRVYTNRIIPNIYDLTHKFRTSHIGVLPFLIAKKIERNTYE